MNRRSALHVAAGEGDCILSVIQRHRSASGETEALREAIVAQYADWLDALTRAFIGSGLKKKRAGRAAHDFLGGLYGALHNAKMHADPTLYVSGSRRLLKRFVAPGKKQH